MGVSLVEGGVSGSDCLCCRAMRGKKERERGRKGREEKRTRKRTLK